MHRDIAVRARAKHLGLLLMLVSPSAAAVSTNGVSTYCAYMQGNFRQAAVFISCLTRPLLALNRVVEDFWVV